MKIIQNSNSSIRTLSFTDAKAVWDWGSLWALDTAIAELRTDTVQSGKQRVSLLSLASKYLPSHALNNANKGGRDGIHLDTSLDEDRETC